MSSKLPPERLLQVLETGGPLSQAYKNFECRPEQKSMLADVLEAYNNNKIALIEAGTGCGKSMAYLIPALVYASQLKERTVISTNTINLQEQLIHKDVPLLVKALKLDLKVVLVKGMGNYLCLRKLDEAYQEKNHYSPDEQDDLEKLSVIAPKLMEGSRSEILFSPGNSTWEKVSAESDTCNGNDCPYVNDCFFFKARKEAADAQILIVNHHLLFADISLKSETQNYTQTALLPPYSRLILDEAHNIEEIATEYFAGKVNKLGLLKTLSRLSSEKGILNHGKIPQLKEKMQNQFPKGAPEEIVNLINRLSIDLPGMKRDLLIHIADAFHKIDLFLKEQTKEDEEPRLRLKNVLYELERWKNEVFPQVRGLIDSLLRLDRSLKNIDQDIKALDNEKLTESTKSVRHEMTALSSRLERTALTLETITQKEIPSSKVRWIEQSFAKNLPNTHLIDAELDLSQKLLDALFTKFSTIILASATLASNKSFAYIKSRLGLSDPSIQGKLMERIYESPFNYSAQALLAIPADLPLPNEAGFLDKACDLIIQSLEVSRGGAFILFTSYSMLKSCYNKIAGRLLERRYTLHKQGDKARQTLLNEFKNSQRGVLFGTDSFWEGVDVAGEALRLVIIVKLPFKVPTEPIIQARMESILEKGHDPFMSYSLPQAIVKFKQGFGRLIRQKNDRGAILCLDRRLLLKAYGKLFINSLPNCQKLVVNSSELKGKLTEFYKKTYALTKN